MKKVLIRMVGKRDWMKNDLPIFSGCNGKMDTKCLDRRPIIHTDSRNQRFPERTVHLREGRETRIGLQNVEELKDKIFRRRFVPLFLPFVY